LTSSLWHRYFFGIPKINHMKKNLFIVIAAFSFAAQSQEISSTDALRYAVENMTGTARFQAMSGAFGALGGDMSSIMVNPAGSAIFANNQAVFTLSSYNISNTSDYYGGSYKDNDNTFDLNQAGGVFVLENNNPNSDWKKITMAMNYENMNNFSNSWASSGVNPTNSIVDYFQYYANAAGIPRDALNNTYYEYLNYFDAQAFLGVNSQIVLPNNPAQDQYSENVGNGPYSQQNYFGSTGYNGKLAFNIAAQYKDWLYFGLNLNSHFTDYWQSTSFYEQNPGNTPAEVNDLLFSNDLHTYGSAFSLQVGIIAKIVKGLRAGATYQSPTWYRLHDEISQRLFTNVMSVDPHVTVFYEGYNLNSPGKWTGSLAYIFGKQGLISVDCSIKDYGNAKYKPTYDFEDVNRSMSHGLDQNAYEIKVGAEQRYKQWSFRGGYRWEESPYSNNFTMSDLNGFSAGLGYSFGDTKVDLAYSHSKRYTRQGLFLPVITDGPSIGQVTNNVTATLVLEL
jgi:hypothetical protein